MNEPSPEIRRKLLREIGRIMREEKQLRQKVKEAFFSKPEIPPGKLAFLNPKLLR